MNEYRLLIVGDPFGPRLPLWLPRCQDDAEASAAVQRAMAREPEGTLFILYSWTENGPVEIGIWEILRVLRPVRMKYPEDYPGHEDYVEPIDPIAAHVAAKRRRETED